MFALPLLALALLQSQDQQPATPPPPPPHGEVVFERRAEPAQETEPDIPAPKSQPALQSRTPAVSSSNGDAAAKVITISDAQRTAVRITGYDLDLHLNFSTGEVVTHARLQVKNQSAVAIQTVPLQISSSLHWQSARLIAETGNTTLPLEQHSFETDTDHTGIASEAVLNLPQPLAAGNTVTLDLFYEGILTENADRLLAVGATEAQAAPSEWDGFNSAQAVSGVRGFGNVLWYPVAQPHALLGEGNQLLQTAAHARLQQQDVPFHLRITVESAGKITAGFFCGEATALKPVDTGDPVPQNPELPSYVPHLYTAEWHIARIGQRTPNLFLAVPEAIEANSGLLTAYTNKPETLAGYNSAAIAVRPLMQAWFGADPLHKLTLLDLGRAALPLEDGALVALPMRVEDDGDHISLAMTQWLTHAWFSGREAWMSDGLAAFMEGLWRERAERGRRNLTAAEEDTDGLRALSVYETLAPPKLEDGTSSSVQVERQPLTRCAEPICYRTKGAAVWRMLRSMVGDEPLQQALQSFRANLDGDAEAFEAALEKTSGKDLAWFFDGWVLHDRGLPDLSIVTVAPRPITGASSNIVGRGAGVASPAEERARTTGGWLVAVEVANEGEVDADVPVTLRAPSFTSTERLRIPAHSRTTLRMLTPAAPAEVIVNDGTVPETGASTHRRTLTMHAQ